MLRQSAGRTLSLGIRRESSMHNVHQPRGVTSERRHRASDQTSAVATPALRSHPVSARRRDLRCMHSRSTHMSLIWRKIPTLRQRTQSGRRLAAPPPWENSCCCPAVHHGTLVSACAGPSHRRIRPATRGIGFDSCGLNQAPDRARQAIAPRASGCAGGSVVARWGR